jgi:ribose 5-phosphate isomerase B
MRIALGADHAGYHLKTELGHWLAQHGYQVVDVGAHAWEAADDYPDFAAAVGRAVLRGEADLGVMVCGTGVGSSIALNKLAGIRAAACSDTFSARLCRKHNDANVLCLGERVLGPGLAVELLRTWLEASFADEERHRRRLGKIQVLERG